MAARRALPADFTGLSAPPGERLLDEKGNSNGKEECTRRAVCPRGVITLISNMCQESDSSRQGGGGGEKKQEKKKTQEELVQLWHPKQGGHRSTFLIISLD